MTTKKNAIEGVKEWTKAELWIFRFLFIFILIQVIPLDYKFYSYLFSFNWLKLTYQDIFGIAKYVPVIFGSKESYYDWILFAFIAVSGAAIWTFKDIKVKDYNFLYHVLRGVSRYRLAAAIFAYGFLKLFALLAPELSLSTLNTRYGEFTDWKIFSITLGGAKPYYQTFLGSVEILTGILLLNRKTASIGAFIAISFLGNVFLSNLAYGGDEYIYASYLIVLAFFVLSKDAIRLYKLLFLEVATAPNEYVPVFDKPQIPGLIKGLKYAFVFFFIVVLGFKTYDSRYNDSYQIPREAGLPNSRGFYNVKLFVINKDTIPYSTTDTTRWRDVVFEKWRTISIRRNKPVKIDFLRTEYFANEGSDRIYESSETSGRFYYSYKADATNGSILLTNKNRNYKGQNLSLKFSRPDTSTITLDGINEDKDTIHVELQKLDKPYLLYMGRGKALKL